MDSLINSLAAWLGIDPTTLVLLLGVLVAVANIVGKQIPASATGALGTIRKICLLIGLYVPQRITPTVTTKTVAKALAAEVPDEVLRASAESLPQSIGESKGATLVAKELVKSAKVRSPFLVGILAIFATLWLTACTSTQIDRVNSAVSTVCTSAPLAQALYNSAVASGDNSKVNQVLNYLQAACPAVVVLIHTVPVRVETPAPAPAFVGERG